jgi:glycolate oxidase FAD binding subunit
VPTHELRGILASLPPSAQWWASPGAGIAHWSFDDAADELHSARAAAEAAHGSLVLMDAPADVVAKLGAWGTPPQTIQLMGRLKQAFDPTGILNPGRFVV